MSSFTRFCPHKFLIFKLNGLISIFLLGSSIAIFISSLITSNLNIFDSPKLTADFLNEFAIAKNSLESDIELLPDAEARESFNITFEQRERCLREYSVVRVAGYCLFVKKQYDDKFYLQFFSHIVRHLCNHIYPNNADEHFEETANAVEEYVKLACSNTDDGVMLARAYMKRIYDDNENYLKMTLGGIGYIGANMIYEFHSIMRDQFCKAKQGMSYETYKVLIDAIEESKSKSE
jgi:hypothetical protein